MINRGVRDNPIATGRVTSAAHIRSIDMTVSLAARVSSVVATRTRLRTDLRRTVIELRRRPGAGAMTNTAFLAGHQMLRGFFTGVTTGTRAHNLRMVDTPHNPASTGRMAKLTLTGGGNMRRGFAGGHRSVMTTDTVIRDACVIKIRAGKPGDAVA